MMPSSLLALSPAPHRTSPRGRAGWMLCAALLAPLLPHGAAAATPEPSGTAHHHHHHHPAAPGTATTKARAAGTAHHKRHHPAAASATAATTTHRHGHPAAPHAAHAGAAPHRHAALASHARHAAVMAAPVAGLAAAAATAAPAAGTAVAIPPPSPAEPPAPTDKGAITGLPLPRFAALRADEVNMRSGPGQRYPIEWVYHRRDLPVKIEREFDVWRLVEDSDGQKGWVQQATLVGTRSFVIPGLPPVDPAPTAAPAAGAPAAPPAPRPATNPPAGHSDSREVARLSDPAAAASIPGAVMLRSAPDAGSALVAVLKPGTVGILRTCAAGTTWCRVSVQHYSGWLDRKAVWGLLPQETIQPS